MILVSACLAGVKCRYDGRAKTDPAVRLLVAEKKAMPFCPDLLGGRRVPRNSVEIVGGTGADVLAGRARVKDKEGNDVTEETLAGVKEFIKTLHALNAEAVILKTKSPVCGFGEIYDGTFTGTLIEGNGVLGAALAMENIVIYTEYNIAELLKK